MSGQKRMSAADYRLERLVEMPEADFLRDVRQLAKKRRWLEFHTYDSRRSTEGFPDFVAARQGRIFVAELKAVTGRWGEGQKEWLAEFAGDSPEDWHFDRWADGDGTGRLIVGCFTPLSWDLINDLLR